EQEPIDLWIAESDVVGVIRVLGARDPVARPAAFRVVRVDADDPAPQVQVERVLRPGFVGWPGHDHRAEIWEEALRADGYVDAAVARLARDDPSKHGAVGEVRANQQLGRKPLP